MRRLLAGLRSVGLDLRKLAQSVCGVPAFLADYLAYSRADRESNAGFPRGRWYPALIDRYDQSGEASGHYFHQDLLVASRVFALQPRKHVDIGSRVDGLVAHIASFRELEVFDIRDLATTAANIRFVRADITDPGFSLEGYCDSISSLHVVEHLGLGRYGDRIDPTGHLKGLRSIHRMLLPQGVFHFSTPIGPQRVEFNAHRVFSLAYLMEIFSTDYVLESLSIVDDRGELWPDVTVTDHDLTTNFGCHYGCGIFQLRRT